MIDEKRSKRRRTVEDEERKQRKREKKEKRKDKKSHEHSKENSEKGEWVLYLLVVNICLILGLSMLGFQGRIREIKKVEMRMLSYVQRVDLAA